MRLFVKIKDASMVCVGEERFPIKNQVVDVPDLLGASLISRDEYEVYTEQIDLHEDFIAGDKASDEAAAKAQKEADKEAKKAELAEAKRLVEETAESERLEKEAAEAEEKRLADEAAAQAPSEEANNTNESTPE